MGRLEGKVAFITGSGSGIARAAARACSRSKARASRLPKSPASTRLFPKVIPEHAYSTKPQYLSVDDAQIVARSAAMQKGISHWNKNTSQPLAHASVGDALRSAAERAPDAAAVISVGPPRSECTFSGLCSNAERAARALLARFRECVSAGEKIPH